MHSPYDLDRLRLSVRTTFLMTLALLTLLGFALPSQANAADVCLRVDSWSQTGIPGRLRANYQTVTCTTIPLGWGWTTVTDVSPSTSTKYHVRLNLNSTSPRWRWNGGLSINRSSGIELISRSGAGTTWLRPYPPQQGGIGSGSVVRLRHANTGKCVYTTNSNFGFVYNWSCWDDSNMTFVVENAGSGTYRLRNVNKSQCPYATGSSNAPARTIACTSSSTVIRFKLDSSGSGFRLRTNDNGQCLYGSSSDGGQVRSSGCSSSSNFRYYLDRLQ